MANARSEVSDSLSRYFDEIGRFGRLSRDQESRLSRRIQGGCDDAVRSLVEAHLPFVAKIAYEYAGYGVPLEDLINEGNVGLLEAARRFDHRREAKFISYAAWWVRRSILKALSDQSGFVSLPWTTDRRGRRRPIRTRRLSLDTPRGSDREGASLGERLEDTEGVDVEATILRREVCECVDAALDRLTEVERFVLIHRFGLRGVPASTLREIGGRIGLTRERVRQIEAKAKGRVRRLLLRRRWQPTG